MGNCKPQHAKGTLGQHGLGGLRQGSGLFDLPQAVRFETLMHLDLVDLGGRDATFAIKGLTAAFAGEGRVRVLFSEDQVVVLRLGRSFDDCLCRVPAFESDVESVFAIDPVITKLKTENPWGLHRKLKAK